jgi:predicted O-methyltransferase YrrM
LDRAYAAISFLKHWFSGIDAHSVHSPFVFDFYQNVWKTARPVLFIENQRKEYLLNKNAVQVRDYGAGSVALKEKEKQISQIAKYSSKSAKWYGFLNNLVNHYGAKNCLELGTSLGLGTAALANSATMVSTFEGSQNLIDLAERFHKNVPLNNITYISGSIDNTLSTFLENSNSLDLVFIDANHRYAATIKYFNLIKKQMSENGIIVIDDIYWSKEMNKAWEEIKNETLVRVSIDLYHVGVLFFDQRLSKQDFVIK